MPITRAPARSLDEVKKSGCFRCGGPHFKKDKNGRICNLPLASNSRAASVSASASASAPNAHVPRQWSLVAQSLKHQLPQNHQELLSLLQADVNSLKSQMALLSAQAASLSHIHLALHTLLPVQSRLCCGESKNSKSLALEQKFVAATVAPSVPLSDALTKAPASSAASKSAALALVSPRPHGKTTEEKNKDVALKIPEPQVVEFKRVTSQNESSQSAESLVAPFNSPNRAASNDSMQAISASKQVSSASRSPLKRSRDTDDLNNSTPTKKAAVSRSQSLPAQPLPVASPFEVRGNFERLNAYSHLPIPQRKSHANLVKALQTRLDEVSLALDVDESKFSERAKLSPNSREAKCVEEDKLRDNLKTLDDKIAADPLCRASIRARRAHMAGYSPCPPRSASASPDSKLSNTKLVAKQSSPARPVPSQVRVFDNSALTNQQVTTSIINLVVPVASSSAADVPQDSMLLAQVSEEERLKAKNAKVLAKRKERNANRAAKKKASKAAAQPDNTSSQVNPASSIINLDAALSNALSVSPVQLDPTASLLTPAM